MVQKICTFLGLTIGPTVGKVLNTITETKKGMWQIRWHHKDTKKGLFVFCSFSKTIRAINMKFGYILENSMLNPSPMLKKKVSCHRLELICINCMIMSTFFHQSCKNTRKILNSTADWQKLLSLGSVQ